MSPDFKKALFEPQGNFARHLNTLAALIAGMVQSKSSQLPKIASHVPGAAKTESRIKRFSRWLKNWPAPQKLIQGRR